MAIRTVKPTSPSLRYLTYVTYDDITKKEPEKGLLRPKRRTNGRNVYGRITVRHRGGGAKQMVRQVDFRREKYGIPARVAAIEYDPNRSARPARSAISIPRTYRSAKRAGSAGAASGRRSAAPS